MAYVWTAYDALRDEVLARVDLRQPMDDAERDITELLHGHLCDVIDKFGPFWIRHEVGERESKQDAPARPPTYDMAFALRQNPRVMWPLEAKVLYTPRQIADYVATFHERFMTCVYAPFSSHGSMLAYLFSGDANETFAAIADGMPCQLEDAHRALGRPHKTSRHTRTVPRGKSYPMHFICHHLVLLMRASGDNPVAATRSAKQPTAAATATRRRSGETRRRKVRAR